MIVIDYLRGSPGWVRTTWTGTHLAWCFDGVAAGVLDRVGATRVDVSRPEMRSIIRSAQRTTSSPWGPGGYPAGHPQHDNELDQLWAPR